MRPRRASPGRSTPPCRRSRRSARSCRPWRISMARSTRKSKWAARRPSRNSPAMSTPRNCRRTSANSASSCAMAACAARRSAAADSSSPAAWRPARATWSSTARWTSAAWWTSKIIGQNFLAADIPAANVVVTPDLTLTGDPKGYLLQRRGRRFRAPPSTCRSCRRTSRPACRPTWWWFAMARRS